MPDKEKIELQSLTKSKKEEKKANDPSLPSHAPSSSQKHQHDDPNAEEPKKKFWNIFYNRETKEYCGRTCISWLKILSYAIIYLLFLSTYTLLILYISLLIIKKNSFEPLKPQALIYPITGVGLTAIPTSETNNPLIWYKKGDKSNYGKYIKAIEEHLRSDGEGHDVDKLGPCGRPPFGYGDNPCVIIKINRHFHWSGRPLQLNSSTTGLVPPAVIKWMKTEKNKLWLECGGYHSYDKEHIGSLKYYPYPPGFDSALFPLKLIRRTPFIAIQIINFTVGMSLAIECKLWYENGPSVVDFVLYVAPNDSIAYSGQTDFND